MDVRTTIERMRQVSSIFGLSQTVPEKVEKTTRYKIQKRQTIYAVFIVVIQLSIISPLNYFAVKNILKIYEHTILQICGGIIYSVGHVFGAILAILSGIYQQNIFCAFLNELVKETEILVTLTGKSPKMNTRTYFIAYGGFIVTAISCDVWTFRLTSEIALYRVIVLVVEYIGIIFNIILSLQFCLHAQCIAAILHELKNGLEKRLSDALQPTTIVVKPQSDNLTVRKLIQRSRLLYHDLYETSGKIDRFFSTPNLWTISFMTFVTVFTFYNRFEKILKIVKLGDEFALADFIEMTVWSIYGVCLVYILILVSENVKNKSLDLWKCLIRHFLICEDPILKIELQTFIDVIGYEKIKFSPHGLFSLSKKMTLTVIGVCVTYLVMFTQIPKTLDSQISENFIKNISENELSIWIFGLSQIAVENKRRFKIETWRTIYSIVIPGIIIFGVTAPVQIYALILAQKTEEDMTGNLGRTFYNFGHISSGIIMIINNLLKQNAIKNVVNDLVEQSDAIHGFVKIQPKTKARKLSIAFGIFLLSVTICEIHGLASTEGPMFQGMFTIFMEYFEMGYNILITLQFGFLALCIAGMFSAMEQGLENYLDDFIWSKTVKTIQPKIVEKFEKPRPEIFIQRYRIFYHDLYEASQKLNKIYGTTNTWIIFFMTYLTIFFFYHRVCSIYFALAKSNLVNIMDLFETIAWSFYGTIVISALIYSCEEVNNRGEDLKRTVNKYLARSENENLTNELTRLLSLIKDQKIQFSPHGLFTIRSSIVMTIMGVSVSYVAILTQLPKNIEKE